MQGNHTLRICPWKHNFWALLLCIPDVFASLGLVEPVEVFLWAREKLSKEREFGLSSGARLIMGLEQMGHCRRITCPPLLDTESPILAF